MELSDARAIVTGAARGLGRCFARELVRAGARVAVGDLDVAGLRTLREELGDAGEALMAARLDITDEAVVRRFVDDAARALGGVNVLVNNAGILRDGLLVKVVDDGVAGLAPEQWRRVVDVNLTGQFLMAREVAGRMITDGVGGGVIVNLSSLARAGNPGQSSYAASKAGLDAATRTWALELAPHGIRVASVAPGVIDTPILEGISGEALEALRGAIPVGRLGRPEEVFQAVRFVLECDFFTGRTLEVDGGAAMGGG